MRPRFSIACLASALILSACGGSPADVVAAVDVEPQPLSASLTSSTIHIEIETGATVVAPPATVITATSTAPAVSTAPTEGQGSTVDVAPLTPSLAPPGTARSAVVAQAVVAEVTARVAPADDAAPVATMEHPTAVGSPLVFVAVEDQAAPVGWLEVRLPVQPNGTTGWVRRSDVTLFENPYRIEIDRDGHLLQVLHLGEPWLETTIAVGTGATPTPDGEFYLLELLAPPDPTGPYGPYAFGLSGFSEVLDSFGGADVAIIGIHGTDDPSVLGTDVSFGCVRLANDVIAQLATTLPLGTPVRIT